MLTMSQCLQKNIAEQPQLSKRGDIFNRVSAIYSPPPSFLRARAYYFPPLRFVYLLFDFLYTFNKIFLP